MSKILKALEKAQKEGVPSPVYGHGEVDGGKVAFSATSNAADALTSPSAEPSGRVSSAGLRAEVVSGAAPVVEPVTPSLRIPAVAPDSVDAYIEILHRPLSMVAEQYRNLRNRLERLSNQGGQRVVAFTSAVKGEGKSVTAVNLSLALAQDANKRILLVDADLRRPRVHQMLGLAPTPGLADVLQGRATLEQVVQPFFKEGLDVVAVGEVGAHPGELLAGDGLQQALAAWRRQYDFVLLDTPPVHPIADVAFLADAVDGFVVVVRARRTSREQLDRLKEHLPMEKIIGSVLNRADELTGRYRYKKDGYGYGY